MIECLFDTLALLWPAKSKRQRRYERIGWYLGLKTLATASLALGAAFLCAS